MKGEFICVPYNTSVEILILFLTIPCILGVIRRNRIIATLYFGMYGAYFGTVLYNDLTASTIDYFAVLMNALGIILPLLIFLDIIIQKSGIVPSNIESDWYYDNEKYDRQYDERADRNQYKIR